MKLKILLLEDDKLFNETLQDFLEEEDFEVDCVLDPYSALDFSYENNYDLYLFDVNLPYESGFDLLKRLRESGDQTPTIFITSRNDKDSLRKGFLYGGDDYIKKPVDLDELHLRINALLRRQIRSKRIILDAYEFDTRTKRLFHENKEEALSIKSGVLLFTLLEAQGTIVHTHTLKERLWSSAEDASDGALRVYVAQVKKYFPKRLKNIRGVGYLLLRDSGKSK